MNSLLFYVSQKKSFTNSDQEKNVYEDNHMQSLSNVLTFESSINLDYES